MKTENWKLKIWGGLFFILYSLFFIPAIAHAQIVPRCNPVPNPPGAVGPLLPTCDVMHLFELLVNIYNFLLGLAGLVAMLFIIWAGLRMLYFSYLEDSAAELSAAKLTVRRAIGGFVIIALAYLLVNTVLTLLGIDRGGPIGQLLQTVGLLQ